MPYVFILNHSYTKNNAEHYALLSINLYCFNFKKLNEETNYMYNATNVKLIDEFKNNNSSFKIIHKNKKNKWVREEDEIEEIEEYSLNSNIPDKFLDLDKHIQNNYSKVKYLSDNDEHNNDSLYSTVKKGQRL